MTITNIYKTTFQNHYQKYLGLLRNEKRFIIGDLEYIVYGDHSIYQTTITRLNLSDVFEYPKFIYKIEIPKEMAIDEDNKYIEIICDTIFNSIEEAKQSRIKQAEKLYKLEVDKINQFFKQYENKK